ncbi:MAG: DUF1571 domain-containing protein [Sedimentisphaerales bacterium]|nr:DUF1571 domain-containing protein [Sedimentisphaerales bacterium]
MTMNRTLPLVLAVLLVSLSGCNQPLQLFRPSFEYPSSHIILQNEARGLDASLVHLAQKNPRELFRRGLENTRDIRDMQCRLIRRERLGDNLTNEQDIAVKYLARPFAVQLTWVKNPGSADRVLYVEGENDGKLLAVPVLVGFLTGPVAKDTEGADARKSSRRPITQFGYDKSLARLLEPYETGQLSAGGTFEDRFLGAATVAGQESLAFERVRTGGDPVDDADTAVGWQVFLDAERLFPIGIIEFNCQHEMLGYYVFTDLQYNTGLTLADLKTAFKKLAL